MRTAVYVLTGICVVLMLLLYSLLVVASDADERAEEMYRRWKESKDE